MCGVGRGTWDLRLRLYEADVLKEWRIYTHIHTHMHICGIIQNNQNMEMTQVFIGMLPTPYRGRHPGLYRNVDGPRQDHTT